MIVIPEERGTAVHAPILESEVSNKKLISGRAAKSLCEPCRIMVEKGWDNKMRLQTMRYGLQSRKHPIRFSR
jgi:hypothetical protein